MKRVFSIDFTRGLVMIIMALDHVRDLIHIDSITQSPTDLTTTTPVLFFTRWITHLCAPVFVFLAGTSAYISYRTKNDSRATKRFLFTRGLSLIILDFTLVNFGMFFDPEFHTLMFEVIATIGFGFIVLTLVLNLKSSLIAIIGIAIIFLHNLVPLTPLEDRSAAQSILSLLFGLQVIPLSSHFTFIMAYPPIPWLGIMMTGFAAGRLFEMTPNRKLSIFLKIGLSALILFTVLRFLNFYGDPVPWSVQKNTMFTFLSFLNISKYPPSLLFCLITLGIMFIIFAFAEKIKGKFSEIVSVFGKVPFFYFLVHFYLIHILLLVILLMQGFHWNELDFASGNFGRPKGAISGVSLGTIYLIWPGIVILLYKPCVWYSRYKLQNKQRYWWLRYI